jgi:hypothetical protein
LSDDNWDLLEKYVQGREILEDESAQLVEIKRKAWKAIEFGQETCDNEGARKKYLNFKYYKPAVDSIPAMVEKQNDLLRAIRSGEKEKIEALRQEYQEKFPDQIEGVVAMFRAIDFFDGEKRKLLLNKKKSDLYNEIKDLEKRKNYPEQKSDLREKNEEMDSLRAETKSIIRELAAYQALLIDFVRKNHRNDAFLGNFWQMIRQIDNAVNKRGLSAESEGFGRTKSGALGQAAIMHALEAAGYKPRIAHPDMDAFQKIDFTLDEGAEEKFIQAKATRREDMGRVLEIDELVLPGLLVKAKDGKEFHVTDNIAREHGEFRESMAEYKKRLNLKELPAAYMIVASKGDYAENTGFPTQKFNKLIEDEIGKKRKI